MDWCTAKSLPVCNNHKLLYKEGRTAIIGLLPGKLGVLPLPWVRLFSGESSECTQKYFKNFTEMEWYVRDNSTSGE